MNDGKKIATVGMFDGVHRGHIALLNRLKSEAEERGLSPCVFTFDRHPLALISPDRVPPQLMSLDERLSAIRNAGINEVNVLNFDEHLRSLTAKEFIRLLRDNYGVSSMIMGFNHSFGSDRLKEFAQYRSIGDSLGVSIKQANELKPDHNGTEEPICSSSIRRALTEGDVIRANLMLGYNYRLRGKVVSGRQLGRTIGFPTANVSVTDNVLVPSNGVYAVDVNLPDKKKIRGMLNIGYRPTVISSDKPAISIEVHLIDWNGNLYGHEIEICFVKRLRKEQRFDSLEGLKAQLRIDLDAAKNA